MSVLLFLFSFSLFAAHYRLFLHGNKILEWESPETTWLSRVVDAAVIHNNQEAHERQGGFIDREKLALLCYINYIPEENMAAIVCANDKVDITFQRERFWDKCIIS